MRKRCMLAVLAGFFLSLFCPMPGLANEPRLTAPSAILLELATGQVLYARNADQPRPPASTTKVLTSILALEMGSFDEPVRVSRAAASTPGSTANLVPNISINLGELVKAALIVSGNDATVAIAEHLAGSQLNFALLMERKAWLLGAKNARFKNPNGLPAPGHALSAADLASICAYCLKNPAFREIVSTRETVVTASDGLRQLTNTNALLWDYQGADGVKTGTTYEAGQCLVASATRGGRQLLSVVLGSFDRWSDSCQLLDHGFQDFYLEQLGRDDAWHVAVKGGKASEVAIVPQQPLALSLPSSKRYQVERLVALPGKLVAPVKAGQVVGRFSLREDGKELVAVPLIAAESVAARSLWSRIFGS